MDQKDYQDNMKESQYVTTWDNNRLQAILSFIIMMLSPVTKELTGYGFSHNVPPICCLCPKWFKHVASVKHIHVDLHILYFTQ